MKYFFIGVIIFLGCLRTGAQEITIELRTLAKIPEKRHAALVLYAIIDGDGSPEISNKRLAYYAALRLLAEEIRNNYYWHKEFPEDIFAGIESRAAVLTAAHYPASASMGCSAVDAFREDHMNTMAEELIVSMARAIFERAREPDVKIVGEAPTKDFSEWQRRWANAVKGIDGASPVETEAAAVLK
jgi:hypothetical protein